MDRDAVRAYLKGDAGVDRVLAALNEAFERGITAVPAFLFEDEFLVPGAVDTQTFTRILEQMRGISPAAD
jgi:predicted DsbA family dithiol-disulfide isomerase